MTDDDPYPTKCPTCGRLLDFAFSCKISDIPAMVINREWLSLGTFPARVYCPKEHFFKTMTGTEFTIDLDTGVIIRGRLRGEGE